MEHVNYSEKPATTKGFYDHPVFGRYWLHYDPETGCFGITKGEYPVKTHCGYPSLWSALKAKGF